MFLYDVISISHLYGGTLTNVHHFTTFLYFMKGSVKLKVPEQNFSTLASLF